MYIGTDLYFYTKIDFILHPDYAEKGEWLYMVMYGHVHLKICTLDVRTCILDVWTCILDVWTCILDAWTCFWGVWSYILDAWTCIIGVWTCILDVCTCIWVSLWHHLGRLRRSAHGPRWRVT